MLTEGERIPLPLHLLFSVYSVLLQVCSLLSCCPHLLRGTNSPLVTSFPHIIRPVVAQRIFVLEPFFVVRKSRWREFEMCNSSTTSAGLVDSMAVLAGARLVCCPRHRSQSFAGCWNLEALVSAILFVAFGPNLQPLSKLEHTSRCAIGRLEGQRSSNQRDGCKARRFSLNQLGPNGDGGGKERPPPNSLVM